jgi:hypothetical protein
MTVKLLAMDDVGTRMEHLADLQDLWSFALGLLTAGTYHTEPELEQTSKLETALELLEAHMLTGYCPTAYAQTINNLPKPEKPSEDKHRENKDVD